jgi:hypothetical protein
MGNDNHVVVSHKFCGFQGHVSSHVVMMKQPAVVLPKFAFVTHFLSGIALPELKRLVASFPPQQPGFDPGSGQVGFFVDKVALRQVFSEYFGFPYQSTFHQIAPQSPSPIIWAW